MNQKVILGVVSIAFDLVAHGPYIKMVVTRKVKPHMFSWIVWTITMGTAFAAQVDQNAGPGAWPTGFAVLLSIIVTILSIMWGEKNITRGDWISFVLALAAMPLWYFTKSPVGAVLLVTSIDMTGYYPTMRKSFHNPWEESAFLYSVATLSCLTSLFALENVSIATAFHPAMLIVCNMALFSIIVWRRFILRKT